MTRDPSSSRRQVPRRARRRRGSRLRGAARWAAGVPGLRRLVRPSRNLYRRLFTPLRPPVQLDKGRGDFTRIGRRWLSVFVELGGLRPEHRVLDVGCGSGRVAVPLGDYLSPDGEYRGFDIQPESIEWCRRTISKRFPNLRFEVADVYNAFYNPEGRWHPHEYRFPYEDASFDLVFLTSVFTHMRSPEVRQYLSEIARVLRPGGRCVISFFLLNPETRRLIGEGKAKRAFRFEMDGSFADDEENPEAAIAYEEPVVREVFGEAGLRIVEPIHYGRWSGRAEHLMGQDVVVAERPQ